MVMESDKLAESVNKSGFPLQIGVAAVIRRTASDHQWRVLYNEHSWKNPSDGASGFTDLVLMNTYGTSFMNVECKRELATSWIFLIPDPKQLQRRHAKAWVARYRDTVPVWFDWADITLEPTTPESAYCVIPGHDRTSRPLLERIGAELVSATEALAVEEWRLRTQRKDALRLFFNVLLTTASLKICEFSPDNVSMNDGKIDQATFREVPYLRFRKQLSARLPGAPSSSWETPDDLAYAKAHTVFIVNAEHLIPFLQEFSIDDDALRKFDR